MQIETRGVFLGGSCGPGGSVGCEALKKRRELRKWPL
jgi:hypothetical protein